MNNIALDFFFTLDPRLFLEQCESDQGKSWKLDSQTEWRLLSNRFDVEMIDS